MTKLQMPVFKSQTEEADYKEHIRSLVHQALERKALEPEAPGQERSVGV